MKETPWKIRRMKAHHIQPMVETHLRAFPGFFLSLLGPRFLKELYSAFLNEGTSITFVAEDASTRGVVGFAMGTDEPKGFFRRLLKRRWWAFCFASANALLHKPGKATRVFRALFYRGGAPPGPERALLSSFAVAPEERGNRLGQALLARWVQEVCKRGKTGCYLTTDAANNEAVSRFYEKSGWRLESTYVTPEGRKMNRYVLDFEKSEGEVPFSY